ncbi:MAG: hypothetical protein REJ23_09465 [Brevundimonas sp.]|nr:hypothetical protein [Brevundimonas sp.]
MSVVLVLALALLGQDAPAPSAAASAPAATTTTAATPAGSNSGGEIVCRREPVLGSNRVRRVCERAEVAEYHREQSRRWFDNYIDRRAPLDCETGSSTCPTARVGSGGMVVGGGD